MSSIGSTSPHSRRRPPSCELPALLFVVLAAALQTGGCISEDAHLEEVMRSEAQTSGPASITDPQQLITDANAALATRRPRDLLASAELFKRAVALDNERPEALSGLANASALIGLYSLIPPEETMPRALSAAEQALKLDPGQSSTWASLGLARYLYSWDFAAAESAFQRSIELNPNAAGVRHWYAMMLSALNQHENAIKQIEAAVAIEPDSRLLNTKLATVLTAADHFDLAEQTLNSAAHRFSDYSLVDRERGFLHLRQQNYSDAVVTFRRALEGAQPNRDWYRTGSSKTIGALAHALAANGQLAEAQHLIELLKERRSREYVPAMVLAHAYAGMSIQDSRHAATVFAELNRALDDHDPGLVYLHTKAGFEHLDPKQLASVSRRIFGEARS